MHTNIENQILYMDNHLLVMNKPAGVLVQGDSSGDQSLLDMCKMYLKGKFNKPGKVYLGLVQRIDRPVSGIVVFARTSKAAGRLSSMIRERKIIKKYWALVQGKTEESNNLVDYITREGVSAKITDSASGKRAELNYQRLGFHEGLSWLEIDLITGRHHQIRVQFAHRKHPIVGDFRYGSKIKFGDKALALHAVQVGFPHPVKDEFMQFNVNPPSYWPAYCKKE